MKKAIILGSILFLTISVAFALPEHINYQGVLRDSSGNLVTGNKSMVFNIYTAATGGTAIWTMTSPEVAVNNGLYTVKLGPLASDTLGTTGSRWLEVSVDGTALSPRLEILAVAYAVTAASAESATYLGGYAPAVSGNNIIPVTDGSGKLNSAVIPSSGGVSHADSADYATLSGTATTAGSATNADYAVLSGTATNAGNADTVDNFDASSTPTAGTLYPLDSGAKLSGVPVSAEAGSAPFALFINGKFGAADGICVGEDQISAGGSSKLVSNTNVTANSKIFVTPSDTGYAYSNNRGLRVRTITAGTSFLVETLDGNAAHATQPMPFFYLIIN